MRIISFAWTTPALLAGHKTVTRRHWKDTYARRFRAGDLVAAYDRTPRHGGRQVATIRLTQAPYKELLASAADTDYAAEGFAWLSTHGYRVDGKAPENVWADWMIVLPGEMRVVWVIRFELVEVIHRRAHRRKRGIG